MREVVAFLVGEDEAPAVVDGIVRGKDDAENALGNVLDRLQVPTVVATARRFHNPGSRAWGLGSAVPAPGLGG